MSKTKTMTFNAENNDTDYPSTICKLGETDVENVKVPRITHPIQRIVDGGYGNQYSN